MGIFSSSYYYWELPPERNKLAAIVHISAIFKAKNIMLQ